MKLSFALALGVCALPGWAVVTIALTDPTMLGSAYSGVLNYQSIQAGSSGSATSLPSGGGPASGRQGLDYHRDTHNSATPSGFAATNGFGEGSVASPEPGMFALVGGALAGIGIWRRTKTAEVQQ